MSRHDLNEDTRFPDGVSGYSLNETDAVIWARVRPQGSGPLAVQWEVFAEDPQEPLRAGLVLAQPSTGFAVRVVLTGLPSGPYRFRFLAAGVESPLGELWVDPRPALSARGVRAYPVCRPTPPHPQAGPSAL